MPEHNTEQAYQKIVNRLYSLRTQWRLLRLVQGLLLWLGIIVLALSVALVIDQLLSLPHILRMGLVLLVLGIDVYTGIRYFIRPIFARLTTNRVAAYIERCYPDFDNRILSAIQLQPEMERNRFGYALEFIDKLIKQARQSIDKTKPKRIFEAEILRIKQFGGLAAGGIMLLIVINLISPTAISEFAQGFNELPKTPQELLIVQIDEIAPGNARIESGADVTILAKVTGHLSAPVYLYYRVGQIDSTAEQRDLPENKWRSILMTRNDTQIVYQVTVENVAQSMEYCIKAKETKSAHYKITVAREPIVSRFQLRLNFPKYTQLSSEVLEENLGDVAAVVGTEVQFEGEGNKPLASGTLVFDESPLVKLRPSDRTKLNGSFIIQRSERYHIELIDTYGSTNSNPILYTINAVHDAEPVVEIVEPGRDLVLDDSMIVALKIDVKDDYGIAELRLIYKVERKNENPAIVLLNQWELPQTAAHIEFSWDADRIGLYPEDVVSYHLEAIDADNVTGPNTGKSDTYTLRFPSLDELYTAIESDQEGDQAGLEALFEEQTEATEIVDELLDKIRKSQELNAKDEQLMQQVLETQRQIERTAEDLVENMKKTAKQMEKNQLFDRETIEKYQELQELMDKALSEEHKDLLRELSETLEQQQLSEQERKLMKANFNQEQFLQQLDQLKELYKQMILQQKLQAAAKQAQELSARQENLMEQLKNLANQGMQHNTSEKTTNLPYADTQDQANQDNKSRHTGHQQDLDQKGDGLAKQENGIADGMDALHEKLDELGRGMSEQTNLQRVADEVKRLNQFARNQQLSPTLRNASSQMQNSRMQSAMQLGQQAQNGLSDLAQGLYNAWQFMEGSNADEALTALREAVRSGLYLSRAHESVMRDTNEVLQSGHGQYIDGEVRRLQALAAKELNTAAGIDQLAGQLWELGKQQMQVDPKVVWRLNEASDALNRSASALEDRKANLATPIQKHGLAALNRVVVELLNAMNQMNQQMSMTGLENMLEQLQQLAQNQGQMNEMSQNLIQQMRQQGKTPGLEQMLKRMSYEQQLIREATGRLAEMMEQFSQALGDLREVAEEMKKVEEKLEGGTINQQVLEKQRQILTRMLESATSLQKRDVSNKRQSKVAQEPVLPVKNVQPLNQMLVETIQQLESNLQSGEIEGIPHQYREQIERYFKALSEQTQGTSLSGE